MIVRFETDYIRSQTKVYMFEDTPHGRVFYKADNTAVTVTEGGQMKDDEVLFCRIPDAALKSFANELDQRGVKTDSDHMIAGKLAATQYHLEDLRKIAKVA